MQKLPSVFTRLGIFHIDNVLYCTRSPYATPSPRASHPASLSLPIDAAVLIAVANKTQRHRFQREGEPGAERGKHRDSVLTNKGAILQHLDMASRAGFVITASAKSPDCQQSKSQAKSPSPQQHGRSEVKQVRSASQR